MGLFSSITGGISHAIGKLSDSPFTNPNKVVGIDLWGREQKGGAADRAETTIQSRTGLPTSTIGRYNRKYGPQTAAVIFTAGAAGAFEGGAGGASAVSTDFVGDLPLDSALEDGAAGAFDSGGSAGVFDSAGNPLYSSPAATAGASGVGGTITALGSKFLDYALRRNLQNAANASRNSVRAPGQSNVSPTYGDDWQHPSGAQQREKSGSLNSIWVVAAIGFALLIIVALFMRSK